MELLNEDQIAQMFHCSKRVIQNMRREGKLNAVKIGKHWLYRKEDIIDYLDNMFDLNKRK